MTASAWRAIQPEIPADGPCIVWLALLIGTKWRVRRQ
jgi:hypothetical protein